MRNFEARAKRYAKKKGTEYKRALIPEEQSTAHFHLIVKGLTLEEINMLWGLGRVTASILDQFNHYEDLARYLLNQEKPHKTDPAIDNTKPPRPKNARRWSGTRNLKRPVVTVTPIKREGVMRRIPAAPKGCTLLPGWIVSCDAYGHPIKRYSYIKPPKKPPRAAGKKGGETG